VADKTPKKKMSEPEKPSRNMAWFFFLIIAVILSILIFSSKNSGEKNKKSLIDLYNEINKDEVLQIDYVGNMIKWTNKSDEKISHFAYIITDFIDPQIMGLIYQKANEGKLQFKHVPPSFLTTMLSSPLPWLLLISLFFFFFMFRQIKGGGGGVLSFGKSRAQEVTPDLINKTFADVAGIEEAKEEVYQIVDFLKEPSKYLEIGARIPSGLLLEGLPGTGKTLLAKAIAGEAGVPFFNISGSDFIEMFVGVGASRVRDLFQQAREKSPCIIFIDEIDAIGKNRGADPGGGERESHQTLNAILVEMDGFSSEDQVIVLAATNRADVLDNALLRPGRFDRIVHVNLPDSKGREQILRVHAKPVKMADDVNFEILAKMTPGYSGADLENLINEGALLAVECKKKIVTMNDLEEARDKTSFGKTRKSKVISEKTKRDTAYHEAGHAIISLLIKDATPLHKVTILPRGHSLGSTMFLPTESQEEGIMTKRQIHAQICVSFGGRIAEELFCDDISTGASQDIEQATTMANRYVTQWGLSEELGPINYISSKSSYFGKTRDCSQQVSQKIDSEIKKLIDDCYKTALDLINDHHKEMNIITDMLVEKEILSVEEICDATGLMHPAIEAKALELSARKSIESKDTEEDKQDENESDKESDTNLSTDSEEDTETDKE